ncbi:MAG: YkvA family protein [Planctomycetota bacterium]|jgi:uncharacterized membrane protein YkvA (DUF1232 family)
MEIPTLYERIRDRLATTMERVGGRLGRGLSAWTLAGPDLCHLLVRVIADPRVSRARRGELVASIVYLVSPIDLVPEALLGPLGVVDDAFVLARLLDCLLNKVPAAIVAEHWAGDPAQLERLQRLAAEGRKIFSLGFKVGVAQLVRRAELPFAAARVASLVRRAASSALRGFASRSEDRSLPWASPNSR